MQTALKTTTPVVLFDGVCNFCNRMVSFAIRHDKKGALKFAPIQSAKGREYFSKFGIDKNADTVILVVDEKVYTYAGAAIRICRYLDWPVKVYYGFIIVPSFISQPLYKWFAARRYKWFGKKESCMVPTEDVKDRFL
ncbi:MAG TPA: DCC1-like thiol-disulfide oxidoreductase family protein [Chitinophagaceae bacterium]|nr:DUF393 domain-containing protein [Chitinophagaceae bacterium]MCB0739507.1 DUF393 domain-containing protein [Chitinophagaceae bacterium]HQV06722.1 DCC1-like thiol-disulfide oxidoreductase family protein [Chitinophagaceae bacterium]